MGLLSSWASSATSSSSPEPIRLFSRFPARWKPLINFSCCSLTVYWKYRRYCTHPADLRTMETVWVGLQRKAVLFGRDTRTATSAEKEKRGRRNWGTHWFQNVLPKLFEACETSDQQRRAQLTSLYMGSLFREGWYCSHNTVKTVNLPLKDKTVLIIGHQYSSTFQNTAYI